MGDMATALVIEAFLALPHARPAFPHTCTVGAMAVGAENRNPGKVTKTHHGGSRSLLHDMGVLWANLGTSTSNGE